jgi:hypothetical protein
MGTRMLLNMAVFTSDIMEVFGTTHHLLACSLRSGLLGGPVNHGLLVGVSLLLLGHNCAARRLSRLLLRRSSSESHDDLMRLL